MNENSEKNYYFLILSVIPIWAVATNGLVLYCFYKTAGLRQNLSNFIIASMAVDDFLLGLLVLPFAVYLKVFDCWPLDQWTQLVWFCIDVLLSASSITNLLAITMYRYLAIAYPYRFRYTATKDLIRIILITAWFLAFLISLSVFIETIITSHQKLSISTVGCHYMQGSRAFLIYGSLLSFFLPLIIMIWAALRSIHLLKKRNEISEGLHQSTKLNSQLVKDGNKEPSNKETFQNNQSSQNSLFSSKERRAIRTLIVVLVIFVIAWFPFFTIQLVASTTPENSQRFDTLQNLMFDLAWPGYITSCVNPIVYAVFSLEFNRAFRNLFKSNAPSNTADSAVQLVNDKSKKNDFSVRVLTNHSVESNEVLVTEIT